MKARLAFLLLAFLFPFLSHPTEGALHNSPATLAVSGDGRFGVDFVNGPSYDVPESRYQQAVDMGARWTRWPIYWHDIELTPGQLDDAAFAVQDAVVNRDVAHSLNIDAILMGTPSWAATAGIAEVPPPRVEALGGKGEVKVADVAYASSAISPPANLYAPVFNGDGSINRSNYWAYFVYTAVTRYKDRIKTWEIWNEPDLYGTFWIGTKADYYQLLKVAYLAVKKADPQATVVFGGLMYWSDPTFLGAVLDLIKADPSAPANNRYFDVLALHFYVSPYHLYNYPNWARGEMSKRGFTKPVWITESNIPVCNDTSVDPELSCPTRWRGTTEEQANFIVQAYALGAAAGVERIFAFQLYDDNVGPSEWYGFIRNNTTTRPSYTAYQTAAKYLSYPRSVVRQQVGAADMVVFNDTPLGKVTVIWNSGATPITAQVSASSPSAVLADKYGRESPLSQSGGTYSIYLPGATYRDAVTGSIDVGGDPYFIVEPRNWPYKLSLPRIIKGPTS